MIQVTSEILLESICDVGGTATGLRQKRRVPTLKVVGIVIDRGLAHKMNR